MNKKSKIKLEKIISAPAPKILETTISNDVLHIHLAFPILDGIPKSWNGTKRKQTFIREYGKILDKELEAIVTENNINSNLRLSARLFTKIKT